MQELEFLHLALSKPIGIKVRVEDGKLQLFKQRLYALMRDPKYPHLVSLSIMTSRDDPENELWIVHARQTPPSPEEAGPAG